MAKKFYKFCIVISIFAISLLITTILVSANTTSSEFVLPVSEVASELMYGSNQYTQVEDYSINEHKGSLTADDELVKTSSNGLYKLYVNRGLCIFKVENTKTGYIYSSALDEIKQGSATTTYASMLSSSFVIEYYEYNARQETYNTNLLKRSNLLTASVMKDADKEAYVEPSDFDGVYPLVLKKNTGNTFTYSNIADGLKVKVLFNDIDVELTATVTVDNEGLHVDVPNESIIENGKDLISNLYVFPTLGATYNNQTPGYMVIPDGSGALIRYGQTIGNPTQIALSYYSANTGQSLSASDITSGALVAPIFGLVNGVKQDAVLGIIENGSFQSELVISPSGAFNIYYNYLTPRFNMRFIYLLYGLNSQISVRNDEDITLSYHFLSDDQATYIGMAQDYQDYLVNAGELVKTTSNEVKTEIDFILSERTASLFGTKNLTMTSISQATAMISELKNEGVDNLSILLFGWSKYGNLGSTPALINYNKNVGSTNEFIDFIETQEADGNLVYVHNSYYYAQTNGDFTYRSDVARNTQQLRIDYELEDYMLFPSFYYLYPSASVELLADDLDEYPKLGINSLSLGEDGNHLFTYYQNSEHYSRYQTYLKYQELYESISDYNVSLSGANAYLWQYLNDYFSMPAYSSSYIFYTDMVPLIPYVLKGYVDYYSYYANFFSLGEDQLLRALDYGTYLSYVLTDDISYRLKYTEAYNYYTTAYADWKDTIIRNNQVYEPAYEAILNSTIVDRIVLTNGVVVCIYQNMSDASYTSIFINYLDEAYRVSGVSTIAANSFYIMEGKYE